MWCRDFLTIYPSYWLIMKVEIRRAILVELSLVEFKLVEMRLAEIRLVESRLVECRLVESRLVEFQIQRSSWKINRSSH